MSSLHQQGSDGEHMDPMDIDNASDQGGDGSNGGGTTIDAGGEHEEEEITDSGDEEEESVIGELAQDDGGEGQEKEDGGPTSKNAKTTKKAAKRRDECSDHAMQTLRMNIEAFAGTIAAKLYANSPEAMSSFKEQLKSTLCKSVCATDTSDAEIQKRLTDMDSLPILLQSYSLPNVTSLDASSAVGTSVQSISLSQGGKGGARSSQPESHSPTNSDSDTESPSTEEQATAASLGELLAIRVAELMKDRIMKTVDIAASTLAIYKQRIKTGIETLHIIQTWFEILTEKAGDKQELGLTERFTLDAIAAHSIRLADACLMYRYLYTLPYRHPLTEQPTCDPQVLGTNGIDLVDCTVYLIPGLCLKPRGLSESHMDNMTSAFRHVLKQAGHHDNNYIEETMPDGTLKVSGNPFNTTTFKTLVKNLRRNWRKFGPTTVRARTISVYQLSKMYDAVDQLSKHANGMKVEDQSVIDRVYGLASSVDSTADGAHSADDSDADATANATDATPDSAGDSSTDSAASGAADSAPTSAADKTEKVTRNGKRSVPQTIHLSYLRDYLAVVMGIATGARSGALASIMFDNTSYVEESPGKFQLDESGMPKFLRVLIPKHKNDQPAWLTIESNALLSRGPNDKVLGSTAFCVPTLYGIYASKAGLKSGYLFGSLSSRSRAQSKKTPQPPAKTFLANAIKRLLTLIGASPTEMANVTGHSTRRTAIQRAIRCNATDVDIREIADHKGQMTLATYTLDARAEGQAERLKNRMDIDPWLLEWPFRPVRRERLAGQAIMNTKEARRHEKTIQDAFMDVIRGAGHPTFDSTAPKYQLLQQD